MVITMKKFFLSGFICFLFLFVPSIESLEEQEININSNELLAFIKEKKITNIKEFCTNDFCDYLRSTNIEKAIEIFKSKYQDFLKSKTDEETALSTIIKGFPIIKIR